MTDDLDAAAINNRPKWFTIPAGNCKIEIKNLVCSSGAKFRINFKKANAETSLGFLVGNYVETDEMTKTVHLTSDEDVSCLFFYTTKAGMSIGSVVEFDVEFTVDGTRYI